RPGVHHHPVAAGDHPRSRRRRHQPGAVLPRRRALGPAHAGASPVTAGSPPAGPLLSVEDLTIGLRRGKGEVRIVEDVSFDVDPGQRMGIVGESGSGKSLTLRAIAGLLPRGVEVLSGRVEYGGRDLLTMPAKARRALMGPET